MSLDDIRPRRDGGPPLIPRRFRRAGLEFFWVVVGQAAAVLGAIVGVRLLTGVLPPQRYGELALGMTAAMLAQQTLFSPLSGASLRFFSTALERNQWAPFSRALASLMAKATVLLVAGAALLITLLLATGRSEWTALTALALLSALISGCSSVLNGMQNAGRRRLVVAWHDGLAPWLRFLTAVALIRLLGQLSWVAMLGYAIASGGVLASQSALFFAQFRGWGASTSEATAIQIREWTDRIRAYAWPFMTWGIFSWAQLASDRWALKVFATTREVGLYAVLYQLGYFPMTLISSLLSQLVSPVLFERAGDGTDSDRVRNAHRMNRRLVMAVAVLVALATGLFSFFYDDVFSLLVDSDYREAAPFLPWMVLSGGLFAVGQTSVLSVLSGPSVERLIAPKVVTAIVGVVLAFVGAAQGGLAGVVYAGTATSLLYFGWSLSLGFGAGARVSHE